jgi:hypothetical protein
MYLRVFVAKFVLYMGVPRRVFMYRFTYFRKTAIINFEMGEYILIFHLYTLLFFNFTRMILNVSGYILKHALHVHAY